MATTLGPRALVALLGEWRTLGAAYEALSDRLRLLVLDGRVGIDVRLPAERELAEQLQLSRTTVTAAYRRLRELGFASSVRGSGTSTRLPASTGVVHLPVQTDLVDLTKAAMPATALLAPAALAAAEELPAFTGGTGYDPIGLPALRSAVADRYTARGLPTTPDQVLITVGAQQAIALVARAYLSRGDRALIEVPTYPHAHEALIAQGARLVTVPVATDDEDGWDLAVLEAALRASSPTLAYLMPDFQNPTGRSMSAELRGRVLRAAAASGTIVVADETPAELDIDRRETHPPLAAGAEAARAHVITIGSASKTMWGGLRIGWIRAERPILRKLAAVRAGMDLGTPILDQLTVARLVPRLDEIVAERRPVLAAARDAIENALAERFPQWRVPHVDGGLAVWANIGVPASSALALAARGHGLLITAGPRFGIDGAFERFLRIPLTASSDTVTRAVTALGESWPSLSRHQLPELGDLAAVV